MNYISLFGGNMKHHLYFSKQDSNYSIFKEIFNFIDSRKSREIIASYGIKPIETFINDLKISFLSFAYDYELSYILDELKNNSQLRKFTGIKHVPTLNSIITRFSKISVKTIVDVVNRLLRTNFRRKNNRKLTFLVDATPVDVDMNFLRSHYSKEYLKKLNLKWSYSSSKGHYIGYKVTMVLEKESLTPVMILIHQGAPHDSKLFTEIMETLKKSKIIRPLDIMLFDKGYYSYKNYQKGIMDYKIVPLIFPKTNFNKSKLMNYIYYPLELFNNNKQNKKIRNTLKKATNQLLKLIKDWKQYKPVRGYIEDFFKVCKQAFNMHKIHKYTIDSFTKDIYLRTLLITLAVNQTNKTKTALQKFSQM